MKFIEEESEFPEHHRLVAYTMKTEEEILFALDLHLEMKRSYIQVHCPDQLMYTGNGSWSRGLYASFPYVSVSVGCCCAHDCCGHLCGLEYVFIPEPDGITKVIQTRSYNY